MKKISCMLLAACLVLSLAACGRKAKSAPGSPAVPATPEASIVPAALPASEPPAPQDTVMPEPTAAEQPQENEPEPTPIPEPAPSASVPAGPPVTVTKNPTSESLAIGGKTWFIAHADNALSLTWQLVDPNGTVFSLDEAMAANPGLQLEALEGDTIAVSNVPLSLNGWGVRARFDGEGNFAVTEPAYIYVGDFISAYSSVINKYLQARTNDTSSAEYFALQNDISVSAVYAESVGYALKDMDKNGIPELIIAPISGADGPKMIADVYTLVNNEPVSIARSYARLHCYLQTNNTVFSVGSGGAGYHVYEVYKLIGDSLETVEMASATYASDNNGLDYHYQQGHSDNMPDENSIRISEEEFNTWLQQMESMHYVPPLTKIY